MSHLCNISEDFIREARYLLIFNAKDYSFNENFKGNKPIAGTHLMRIELHPHSFSRKISLKTKDKNDYIDVNLKFPFLDLTPQNKETLYNLHKKREYAIILASNTEMITLGNNREPMTLSIDDEINDNGSGKDSFSVTITGQTIIFPRQSKITDMFRVLLFTYPFE
ncbi:hypothetical protein [Capnocytophaga canis]|uniref:Uncharacterized protein n=1 Tax=Capnocytophaga canis TaxID=1848903 RepID=A0A0B7IUV9_9FLAO|nr:hypothetical protein [Capnocytophaga canis]GIM62007.1 hypothetical protein CAPN008_20570 [Capnocytophaga canis]CEN54434.1 conserved hypothetical protein [Capnocytophaga canis]